MPNHRPKLKKDSDGRPIPFRISIEYDAVFALATALCDKLRLAMWGESKFLTRLAVRDIRLFVKGFSEPDKCHAVGALRDAMHILKKGERYNHAKPPP